MSEAIRIQAQPTADPSVCRFLISDRAVFPGGSHVCASAEDAQGSPLLEALFAVTGITQVWITGSTLTIQKHGGEAWQVAGKEIGAAIRAFLTRGVDFAPPLPRVHAPQAQAGIESRIRAILDQQVNPGVAGHGGKIELIEVRGHAAYLKMSGGCQGCGAAKVTLKQGVEKALFAQLPEIHEVIDVTNHDAGRNPFIAR